MTALLPPPVDRRSRWQRVRGPTLLAGGILCASLLLHLRDPHRGGSWGYCPWLFLTGTYCPGCGGLRAVSDLTDGDLAGAASSNLMLVAASPLLVFWWTRTVLDRWRGRVRAVSSRRQTGLATGFLVLALAFAVIRNTGFGAWLAP